MQQLGLFVTLMISSSLLTNCACSSAPNDFELMSIVAGTWGWTNTSDTCSNNAHGFDLDLERGDLTIRWGKPTPKYDGTETVVSSYKILALEPEDGSLSLAMDGETRTDAEGQLVRWRIRFIEFEGATAYVWERQDLPNKGWGPIVRCAN